MSNENYLILVIATLITIATIYIYQSIDARRKKVRQLTILAELMKYFNTSISLYDLFNLHKMIYANFQTPILSEDPYGFFRTKDITKMQPTEVYLGNIFGLWTKNLDYWDNCKDTIGLNSFGIDPKTPIKTLIFNQYKSIIKQGLDEIRNNLLDTHRN